MNIAISVMLASAALPVTSRAAAETPGKPVPRRVEPAPGPRPATEPPERRRQRAEDSRARRETDPRRRRRQPETPRAPSPEEIARREKTHQVSLIGQRGCQIAHEPRLVEQLLAARHDSQVLSLEVWGDLRNYGDGQKVLFYARTPFKMYLSLFWIGPQGDVFVPFHNLRLPAHRNTEIDADAVIVPPLGHERWVAFATLEPVTLACDGGEPSHIETVHTIQRLPHAVGRWEVWSK